LGVSASAYYQRATGSRSEQALVLDRSLKIGSTPKRSRCASMNALTSVGLGRAPWRKTPTPT